MGGHYEKGLFNQLMEVQARLEAMEATHQPARFRSACHRNGNQDLRADTRKSK